MVENITGHNIQFGRLSIFCYNNTIGLTKDGISLFYYRGLGRESFTDESFFPQFGLPDSISEEDKRELEEMCHGNRECIYDIAVTGNMDIGITTMMNGEVFETREAGSLPGTFIILYMYLYCIYTYKCTVYP